MNIQTLLEIYQIDEYTNEKGKNPYLETINRNGMWAAWVGGLDWTCKISLEIRLESLC